jgi:hypothetical protein
VRIAQAIAPGFGGINLEDISAPRCFEIEERLQKAVDIPVFHDDQHGTAIVVLAALFNALKIVKKSLREAKIVVSGIGAAGIACTRMILAMGARNIIGLDTKGALYRGRAENMNPMKEWYAGVTNPRNLKGGILDVIGGAICSSVFGPALRSKSSKMAKNYRLRDGQSGSRDSPGGARYVRVLPPGGPTTPADQQRPYFPGFRSLLDAGLRVTRP